MKEFVCQERDGRSLIIHAPLGEGKLGLSAYLDLVVTRAVPGPISVHCEYDVPVKREELAAADRTWRTFGAIRHDVRTLCADRTRQAAAEMPQDVRTLRKEMSEEGL